MNQVARQIEEGHMLTPHAEKSSKARSSTRTDSRFTSELPRPSIALGRNGILSLVGGLTVLSIIARMAPTQLDWVDHHLDHLVKSPRYVGFFRDVSQIGSTHLTVALAGIGSVAVWRRCRPLAIAFPIAVITGLIVNVAFKEGIDRTRPPDSLTHTSLASFPSGHTIQATIALGMLPPVLYVLTKRRYAAIGAAVIAAVGTAAVGLSRVALGAHWVSDVVGGVLVGILVLLVAETALHRLPDRWMSRCTDCPIHCSFATERDP